MAFETAISTHGQIRLESVELSREIARLKRDGYSGEEISQKLNIPVNRVSRLFRMALADYITPDLDMLRATELSKLDAMERAIADKVQEGNLPAVKTAVILMDRRAKLLGLDMKPSDKEEKESGPKLIDVTVYNGSNPHYERDGDIDSTETAEAGEGDSGAIPEAESSVG